MSGRLAGAILLCALVVGAGLLDPPRAGARHAVESGQSASAFLDRFVGRWIGDGTTDGARIVDSLACARVLGGTFLLMQDREIDGAGFQADTYLGYRVEAARYELYSFNNNTSFGSSLPVRLMAGRRVGEGLVMQEPWGSPPLRYTFEFLDADTFRLTKTFVTEPSSLPFVIQIFRRQPAE